MNIIVTLAGKSIRFKNAGYKKPKFLIKLNNQNLIIDEVVNMFDTTKDKFFFVINKEQSRIRGLKNYLRSIVKNKKIIEIPKHAKGPVYSALFCKLHINNNEKLILTYCDFYVVWDYKLFLREVDGYNAAAPAFKGMHPASFGKTFYAYMKVNKKNELIKLKEKSSFTKKRSNEPASTGIYYFQNSSFFFEYAEKLLKKKINFKEYYVSLMLNLIVKDRLKVKVTYVEKFICLGTPEDLEEYYFWQRFFKNKILKNKRNIVYKNTVNLIPMGGLGSRFKKIGYRVLKPFILLDSENSIIQKSCLSFPSTNNWYFAASKKIFMNKKYLENLSKINKNYKLFKLNKPTKGQLDTCFQCINSKDFLKEFKNHHIFISSCDYSSIFDHKKWNNFLNEKKFDICIWTTQLKSLKVKNYNAFGYCDLKNKINVKKIVEKKTISKSPEDDPMIIGTFWFKNLDLIKEMYSYVKKLNLTINGEYYIANAINLMIKRGYNVKAFNIDQWISFGDPFEIEIYNYWKEVFYANNKRK